MAEGGTDTSLVRNNLDGNQRKKTMEEKIVNPNSGFPEVPRNGYVSEESQPSRQHFLQAALSSPYQYNAYSQHSETALKPLLDAPTLSPWNSVTSLDNVPHREQQRTSPPQSSQGFAARPSQTQEACENDENSDNHSSSIAPGDQGTGAESSIISSYVQCAIVSSSTQGAISTSIFEDTPSNPDSSSANPDSPSAKLQNPPTTKDREGPPPKPNDLSAGTGRPAAPPHPMFYPGAMPSGMMSYPGGFYPNMMCYPLQVGFMQGGYPVMQPMFSGMGSPPFSHPGAAMGPYMMQNISCPPNLGLAASPLTATFGSSVGQPTLDSRNIPANQQGPSTPSSSEDNNSGSSHPSYSINPTNDTRLVRLRKPILDWLRKKLDQSCDNNWEALADERGMNYEDIRTHLTDCRHNRDSPFLKLLETEQFQAYTVGEFLQDVKAIKRKDILMDFDSIVRNNKS